MTLCPYFKAGVCAKGKKCKYSHDMSVDEAKTANIDIYTDPRAKLGKVPDTIITCKNFIEAVESNLYGFNWICPNKGDDCQYRHMLPLGYIINRDKDDDDDDDENKLTLEESIEEARHALPNEGLIPVTPETFAAWKEARAAKKAAELEEKIANEKAKGKKDTGQMRFMSGRALFTYNPDLFVDDEAADNEDYEEESKESTTIKEAANENSDEESKEQFTKVQVD